MGIETIAEHRCFGGTQGYYRHDSSETGTPMRFAVFVPSQAASGPRPVLYFLSGLTCTEENFTVKAGAQRRAAELGLVLVMPDTSPRGTDLPGEHDAYDFGSGAGFYVDATEVPWSVNYRMYSYVTRELPALVAEHFPVDEVRTGVFGHSMGGHGALVAALRNPRTFRSVSAFAPIVSPMRCPWGEKAFSRYLGPDRESWRGYDACALIEDGHRVPSILVDQGLDDQFLDSQLFPERLEAACKAARISLKLRLQSGYDHSYFFIATFAEDHLDWHAARL
ncbi:MAG: S-formylglutathione hydrolase [Gammaproteobacteria bacterium SG8_30]|jgi:S-formylglutathione hydrolase|nr:MAG: S-formylglutathione hydrolase [Gammaproteobacteria bacterium SG8_30]